MQIHLYFQQILFSLRKENSFQRLIDLNISGKSVDFGSHSHIATFTKESNYARPRNMFTVTLCY